MSFQFMRLMSPASFKDNTKKRDLEYIIKGKIRYIMKKVGITTSRI